MGLFDTVRAATTRLFRREPARVCSHRDQIADLPIGERSCPQCVAVGDTWVHLRQCMACGQVGCCDSSKNKHASRHATEPGHAIARSLEPGETWMWCYVDGVLVEPPPRSSNLPG